MFKIGEFSKLALVTVRTLRHYDEVGLLKPEQIDRFTGYRYYSAEQLVRLNRILALKDLGLSLEQIAELLDSNPSREQILGMLKLKKLELQEHIANEQNQLERVSAWLNQLERENEMISTTIEVTIKKVEAIRAISLRDIIPTYLDAQILFGEIMGWLAQNRYQVTQPPIVIYYDEEYKERDVDEEVAFPINDDQVPENDRIKIRTLPPFEMAASTVMQGSYDNFITTYAQLMNWIKENGYQVVGPNREIYLVSGGDNPADYVTEIMFPVAKSS
jgi:DNA-binding transcriptional MerR regulator